MVEQQICGFCGKGADHGVEGPNGAYACWDCLVAAKDVLGQMQQSYTCSFCGDTAPFSSVVAGAEGLYMCASCVDSGIKLLGKSKPA